MRFLLVSVCTLLFAQLSWASEHGVRVGVVGCEDPCFAGVDLELIEGVRLAAERYGLSHEPSFSLQFSNDHCNPATAASVAREMVERGISIVVGHVCEEAAIAASRVYAENDVVYLAPGIRHPDLTGDDFHSVFRLSTRSDEEGKWAARFLSQQTSTKKVGVVYADNPVARSMAEGFLSEWRNSGGTTSVVKEIDIRNSNHTVSSQSMLENNVDAVYVAVTHKTLLSQFVRRLGRDSDNVVMISSGHLVDSLFYEDIPISVKERLFHGAPAELKMYQGAQEIGELSGYYALYGYLAGEVVAKGIEGSGSKSSLDIGYWLRENNIESFVGNINFVNNGDISPMPIGFYGWRDGRRALLRSSDRVDCSPTDPDWNEDEEN